MLIESIGVVVGDEDTSDIDKQDCLNHILHVCKKINHCHSSTQCSYIANALVFETRII